MKTITISEELYEDLIEYFNDRADADFQDRKMMPNKEMKLLSELTKEFEQYNKAESTEY